MSNKISTHAGTKDSPFSSEAEIHPSSGVPLNQSDNIVPNTTLPQNTNFSQLAEHQGIHDWNNSVFDDRWLLKPEEIWNLEARRESVTTISPERLASIRNASRIGDQKTSPTEEPHRSSNHNAHMKRLTGEPEAKGKELRGPHFSTVPSETRWGEKSDMLNTSGKLASGQKGIHTNK